MNRQHRILGAFVLAGVWFSILCLTGGCDGQEGSPSSQVTQPRILAVQADPPVVVLGQDSALRPLLVGLDPSESVTWQFRVCDPWRIIADPTADCGPDDSLPLEGASFENSAGAWLRTASVLAAFPPPPWYQPGSSDGPQEGTGEPTLPGDAEPECAMPYEFVEVVVVAEALIAAPDGTGETRLLATKRVRVTVEPVVRRNPIIENLTLDGDLNPATFTPGAPYVLIAAPRQDSLDVVCNSDGVGVMERVRVYLYTDAGQLEDRSVRVSYTPEGEETAGSTVWTAPDQGGATLWLVGIDRDGGIGWLQVNLSAR